MPMIRRIIAVLLAAIMASAPALACYPEGSWALIELQKIRGTDDGGPSLSDAARHADCAEMNGAGTAPAVHSRMPFPGCADCDTALLGKDLAVAKAVDTLQAPLFALIALSEVIEPSTLVAPRRQLTPPSTAPPLRPTPVNLNDVLLI